MSSFSDGCCAEHHKALWPASGGENVQGNVYIMMISHTQHGWNYENSLDEIGVLYHDMAVAYIHFL